MHAQAYNDAPVVRIFDRDNVMIADLPLNSPSQADSALKAMKLRRREKWIVRDWGYEAKVRFVNA